MGLSLAQRELYHSAVTGGIDYENWKMDDNRLYQDFFENVVRRQMPDQYEKIKPYVAKGIHGMGYKHGISMIAKLKEEYENGSVNTSAKKKSKSRKGMLWAGR
jgi:hypothetical protein